MSKLQIDPLNVAADYIEVLFKDQYLGRADMWRLKMSTINTCVWVGKKLQYGGVIRARVKAIYANGVPVISGYTLGSTKIIFRSESAKYFIFLQLSREMWEFAQDSELMLEKALQGFLPDLFARWKEAGANHVVTIVLFARMVYDSGTPPLDSGYQDPAVVQDPFTKVWRKDFYRVAADFESRTDWSTVLPMVKQAIQSFASLVQCSGGLYKPFGTLESDRRTFSGVNSHAEDGCILEAVNLALNSFDRHYVDRDLLRTGLSIAVVTPGSGTFKVDEKLFRLTSQRMVDNGIG